MKSFVVIGFIIKILHISSNYLDFPFYSRFNEEEINDDNPMTYFINNDIYTNFLIGNNKQLIEMNIKSQQSSTFILSKSCPKNNKAKKFDEQNSETYCILLNKTQYYMYEFNIANYSRDTFTLLQKNDKQTVVEDFKFMLALDLWKNNQEYMGGMLGLMLELKEEQNKKEPDFTDFVLQLKEKEVINTYAFVLDYMDNYNGILHFGNYYHEYNESYSLDDYVSTRAGNQKLKLKSWEINTEKIISGDYIVQQNTFLRLYYELGIVASPTGYHKYINDTFFKNFFDNGTCKEKLNFESVASFEKYRYIECDKNKFDVKTFPNLNFYNSDMNISLILDYNDVFYEYKDKVYFLIIFPIYPITVEYWLMGKPCIKKYKFFLNKDQKTIGLYLSKIENKEEKEKIPEKPTNNMNYIITIIILGIVLVSIIVAIIYYFAVIKKTRKRRANELEDQYIEYTPSSEEDEKKAIN